jgi:hypothetical protein
MSLVYAFRGIVRRQVGEFGDALMPLAHTAPGDERCDA